MKNKILKSLLLVTISITWVYSNQTTTFEFNNLEDVKGKMYIQVFTTEEAFKSDNPPEDQIAFKAGLMVGKKDLRIVISGLKPGNYAAKIFHDVNGNGILDVNSLKIPKEPYGFSNNKKGVFGPPKFKDVLFQIGDKNLVFKVKLF